MNKFQEAVVFVEVNLRDQTDTDELKVALQKLLIIIAEFNEYCNKEFLSICKTLSKTFALCFPNNTNNQISHSISPLEQYTSEVFNKDNILPFIVPTSNTHEPNTLIMIPHQFKTLLMYSILKSPSLNAKNKFKNKTVMLQHLIDLCVIQSPILLRSFEVLHDWLTENCKSLNEEQQLVVLNLCLNSWSSSFKSARKFICKIFELVLNYQCTETNLIIYNKCCSIDSWDNPFKMYLATQSLKSVKKFDPLSLDVSHIFQIIKFHSYLHYAAQLYKVILSNTSAQDFRDEIYPKVILFLNDTEDDNYFMNVEIFNNYFLNSTVSKIQINTDENWKTLPHYAQVQFWMNSSLKLMINESHFNVLKTFFKSSYPEEYIGTIGALTMKEEYWLKEYSNIHEKLLDINFLPELADLSRRKLIVYFSNILNTMYTSKNSENYEFYAHILMQLCDCITSSLKAPNVHRNLLGVSLCKEFLMQHSKNKQLNSLKEHMNEPTFNNLIHNLKHTLLSIIHNNYGSDEVCKEASKLLCNFLIDQITSDDIEQINCWIEKETFYYSFNSKPIHFSSTIYVVNKYFEYNRISILPIVRKLVLQIKESCEGLKQLDSKSDSINYNLLAFGYTLLAHLSDLFIFDEENYDIEFFEIFFNMTEKMLHQFLMLLYVMKSNYGTPEGIDYYKKLIEAYKHCGFINFDKEFVAIQNILRDPFSVFYANVKYFLEQFIQIYSEILVTLLKFFRKRDYLNRCLQIIHLTISTSNFKAIIELDGKLTTHIFKENLYFNDEFHELLKKFFNELLESIKCATYGPYMVRRNPESRVLLHAITSADTKESKPFLNQAICYLVDILENKYSTDEVKTSALHSLQPLVMDNSMQYATAPYLQKICILCLENFYTTEWKLKNAVLQVYGSIVVRILGQGRTITVKDLFFFYPEFCKYFFKKLTTVDNFQECGTAIFMLLSQSFYQKDVFKSCNELKIQESYQRILINIIKTHENHLSQRASEAFLAFCDNTIAPFVLLDICKFLINNHTMVNTNFLTSALFLIKQLYFKFKSDRMFVQLKRNINNYLFNLFKLLSGHKQKYLFFSRFYVNFTTVNDILDDLNNCKDGSLQNIYFYNYLKAALYYCGKGTFLKLLNKYFSTENIMLQNLFFTAIIQRYKMFTSDLSLIYLILNFIANVKNVCLHSKYTLIYIYFLLLESIDDFRLSLDVVELFMNNCYFNNLCDVSMRSGIFLKTFPTSICSKEISKSFLNIYKEKFSTDDLLLRHIGASTLIYIFYTCDYPVDVLELVFKLFLGSNIEEMSEMCKFVSKIFDVHISTPYESLKYLVNVDYLIQYMKLFDSIAFIFSCLNELTSMRNKYELENNSIFDIGSDDVMHHKDIVEDILLNSLKKSLPLLSRCQCKKLLHTFNF